MGQQLHAFLVCCNAIYAAQLSSSWAPLCTSNLKSVLNFADSVWLRVCSELWMWMCCVCRVFVWVCIRSCKTLFSLCITILSYYSVKRVSDFIKTGSTWHLEANRVLFLTILAWNFEFLFFTYFCFCFFFSNISWTSTGISGTELEYF